MVPACFDFTDMKKSPFVYAYMHKNSFLLRAPPEESNKTIAGAGLCAN